MIISDHARDEMQQAGISEDEVIQCLAHGELHRRIIVKGESRYAKRHVFKDKTIEVIYTLRGDEERVITAYPIRRKKWQR
jgi:hypothetical protein